MDCLVLKKLKLRIEKMVRKGSSDGESSKDIRTLITLFIGRACCSSATAFDCDRKT